MGQNTHNNSDTPQKKLAPNNRTPKMEPRSPFFGKVIVYKRNVGRRRLQPKPHPSQGKGWSFSSFHYNITETTVHHFEAPSAPVTSPPPHREETATNCLIAARGEPAGV